VARARSSGDVREVTSVHECEDSRSVPHNDPGEIRAAGPPVFDPGIRPGTVTTTRFSSDSLPCLFQVVEY